MTRWTGEPSPCPTYAHPEAFTQEHGDIKNNWHDNVDYGLSFLASCYRTAKEVNMTGDTLYKGTYSKYNSGSVYSYQKENHPTAIHVKNFWENYSKKRWE